ncbi:MAG: signal peptide peptidase SppA [Bacteroidota bacterium]
MGKFIQFVLASCLGVILATFLLSFIGVAMLTNLASGFQQAEGAKPNSVLKITFEDPIPEQTNNLESNPYELETEAILGLHRTIDVIEKAATDDNIKGILLDVSGMRTGRATSSSLREALKDFQEQDKFITAYSNYYSQGSYYMASVADQVFVHPIGGIDFRGFSAQVPFYKDMMDRLGIKAQIFYAGNFKSATEPFRLKKMSDYNRLQVREYLEGLYTLFLEDIGASRNLSEEELRKIADQYLIRRSEDAVKYGLADQMGYEDEVQSYLKELLGLDREDKLNVISLNDYATSNPASIDITIKDKVAVIYAEGSIVDGEGNPGSVGGDRYAEIIRKVRKDRKVKAIVIRVNSPGGSALASDIIWREIGLAKEAGKPVVASMGDYAASGGYYISCNADSIFTEPNTITGSIGVFAMLPSVQKMLNEKIGISFDTVKTGQFSVGINPVIDLEEAEKKIMQESIEEFYEIFLDRVAKGRGMTRDEVHAVAQGRVWTGERAKELGLADAFGDLETAVAAAAAMADLDEYRVTEYPRVKDRVQQLIEDLTGKKQAKGMVAREISEVFPMYEQLKSIQL